jgi:pimeloyl-ACP methyl ester carboxylesterase
MRRSTLSSLIVALIAHAAAAAPGDVGVVLLHGKGGSPTGYVRELASALESKGYLVSAPAMPWSQRRIYDATFDQAMMEIDRETDSLRNRGAKLVVVAGHSLGANAALGYAASRDRAGGIIALAPGHSPEQPRFRERVGDDVARARELVAAGKGAEKHRFTDVNVGRLFDVQTTAEVYLSWFDPEGPAVMPRSAASFKVPTPLLFVVGSRDPIAPAKEYIFDKAPPHPRSRFVTVSADHGGVPTAAIDEVVSWLALLRQ